MVYFERYMGTVRNQCGKAIFSDDSGAYPIIQGYRVENLLADAPLYLPLYGTTRRRAYSASTRDFLKRSNE